MAIQVPSIKINRVEFIKQLKWFFFAFACLIFFTIWKLPTVQFKNVIQTKMMEVLQPYGISITARESSLSLLLGLRYSMEDVSIHFSSTNTLVKVDSLKFRPKIFSLLLGRVGASASLEQKDSELDLDFSTNGTEMNVDISGDNLDLIQLGLLSAIGQATRDSMGIFASLSNPKNRIKVDASASLDGEISNPSTVNGDIKMKVKTLELDKQSVMGFQLPPLKVQDGNIDIEIKEGRLFVNQLQLGKDLKNDDLTLTVTGDVKFNQRWGSGTLNLKTRFGLSQNVMSKFSFIQPLLKSALQRDGTYAYKLLGTLQTPTPVPGI